MSYTPFSPKSYTGGTLHHFASNLVAYEHAQHTPSTTPSPNTVIFIHGMYGSLLSTEYTPVLGRTLPPAWRLVESELRSARSGFGTSSLRADRADVEALVGYVKQIYGGKIVLLGHSTGCQVALLYASTPAASPVDGIVLQAPVSDREALGVAGGPLASAVQHASAVARAYVQDGRGRDVLPSAVTELAFGNAPMCAARWLSLAEPPPAHLQEREGVRHLLEEAREGEDDMFSQDLPATRLAERFGSVAAGCRVLVAASGADESLPAGYGWAAQLRRWRAAVEAGRGVWDDASGVVDGAAHDVGAGAAAGVLAGMVTGFLGRVEQAQRSA